LVYLGQPLEYTLSFRARRTIGFAVRPDGSVRISAPAGTTPEWVAQQVLRKADWILKHQAAFRKRLPVVAPPRYEAGTTHYFLGQPYTLQLETGPTGVALATGQLVLTTPTDPTPVHIEKLLHTWQARQAVSAYRESFQRIWPRFAEFNLPSPALLVRQMRTRWGSCTPRTNRIRLSLDLVRAAPDCIDYVLLHECCHLLVPDHSARFYELQTRLMPDWERRKVLLNKLPK
jgi:predicted metal-dependent hydrolase